MEDHCIEKMEVNIYILPTPTFLATLCLGQCGVASGSC